MRKEVLFILILVLFSALSPLNAAGLKAIEQRAIKVAPDLKEVNRKVESFNNKAVANSQWHDPTLELGALNFPTDTFNINQEPMTQLRVGLKQMLPRGNSLKLKFRSEHLRALGSKSDYKALRLEILKQVRLIWLERYYWRQVRWVLLKKKATFTHLLEVANAMYANNKAPQKAVLNAKMQISKVVERIINAERAYQTTTAALSRWVGFKMASSSHPYRLPSFPRLPTFREFKRRLSLHPLLIKDRQEVKLAKTTVKLKAQSYKPQFGVGVAYAHRDGRNMNGSVRADFVSAGVAIELPMFPRNRQDKTVKASLKMYESKRYNYKKDYLKLKQLLETSLVQWRSTGDELHVYRRRLIPEAKDYAESTLIAYQNNKTDFPTLAESYIELFNHQLKQEAARFMHAKWKVNLLYLQGK